METIMYRRVDSPLGPILLAATGTGLKRIGFEQGTPPPECPPEWRALSAGTEHTEAGRTLLSAARQLEEYFAGARRAFDLPLAAEGNPFQQRVWRELCRIPFGETRTYGQLAGRIDRPGAARAVGSANARNPLPIVVPCHRVIGADGRLTGYYGGLRLKAFLLELERAASASPQTALL